jgi:hypothetical protein
MNVINLGGVECAVIENKAYPLCEICGKPDMSFPMAYRDGAGEWVKRPVDKAVNMTVCDACSL